MEPETPSQLVRVLPGPDTDRDARSGRFLPGNRLGRAANPAGRPKSDLQLKEVRAIAKQLATEVAPDVVMALYETATKAPLNSVARVTAGRVLLEYALGTPTPRDFADDVGPVVFKWSMSDDVHDGEELG
jgi:hypothetical protein